MRLYERLFGKCKYEPKFVRDFRFKMSLIAVLMCFALLIFGVAYLLGIENPLSGIPPIWSIALIVIFVLATAGIFVVAFYWNAFRKEYIFWRDFRNAFLRGIAGAFYGFLMSIPFFPSIVGIIIIPILVFVFVTFLIFGFKSFPEWLITDNAKKNILDDYELKGCKPMSEYIVRKSSNSGEAIGHESAYTRININGVWICDQCLTLLGSDDENCWRCGNNFKKEKPITLMLF